MTHLVTIADALVDPSLLGGMMAGPTWHTWRTILASMWGLPLDANGLDTFQRLTGRQRAPTRPSRFVEWVVGRRGGKTRSMAIAAVYMAALTDCSPYLTPGETAVVAIIAADRRQARIALSYVVGTLRASPVLSGMIAEELTESVLLTNGVSVEVHTGTIAAPRGRTFLMVCCDETAFWATGDSANPDEEVLTAVRPGLATIPFSLLLVASSPYARRGLLYRLFARDFGKEDAPVLVFQGSSETLNPTLAGDPLIAEMMEEDPERASAEFGAQFRSDIVAFITRQAIEACQMTGVTEMAPAAGVHYFAHTDTSGGSADSFTLAVAHLGADGVAVLDAVRERRPPFSPDSVVADYAGVLKEYGISTVTGDAYGGEWPRERFAHHGISYDLSRKNKSAIYLEFMPALNGERVRLLDLPRLTGQLVGLERRTTRGGRDSVDHAPGAHDDVANAAAGALVQVLAEHRPALVRASSLTVQGQGVPTPNFCAYLLSLTVIALDGTTATVFAARGLPEQQSRLYLLDFEVCPLSAGLCQRTNATLGGLYHRCRPANGIIAQAPLALKVQGDRLAQAARQDTPWIFWNETPPELEVMESVAVCSAALIAEGHVRITDEVQAKAATSPWGGALDFRAGDAVNSPLRAAIFQVVFAALWDADDARPAAA